MGAATFNAFNDYELHYVENFNTKAFHSWRLHVGRHMLKTVTWLQLDLPSVNWYLFLTYSSYGDFV